MLVARTPHRARRIASTRCPATTPPKPGLVRDPSAAGPGIEVEVWELSTAAFGSFVAAVPPPLAIGTVTLADGSAVKGFLCEYAALAGAEEITRCRRLARLSGLAADGETRGSLPTNRARCSRRNGQDCRKVAVIPAFGSPAISLRCWYGRCSHGRKQTRGSIVQRH